MAIRCMLVAAAVWLVLGAQPVRAESLCLASPISVVCPTCPVPLRCYDVVDWLDFFLPGWDAGLSF